MLIYLNIKNKKTITKRKHIAIKVIFLFHTHYRTTESLNTGPIRLFSIKYMNCPQISWNLSDFRLIAKVSFSSARQLDSSLYHCLMSGLSGFFQNSAIVCFAWRREYMIILFFLLFILKLLGNMPRMHSCGQIGMSSEIIWDNIPNTSFQNFMISGHSHKQ